MQPLLDVLLKLATENPPTDEGGAASVGVKWNPYESHWEAEASWSDDTRVISDGAETAEDAVMGLIDLLRR